MEDDFALEPPSNHSSPHEYDHDHFDSNSSSSSGDSPSSDSAYPSSATPSWAFDLGLSVPQHVGMPRDDWGSPLVDPIFGVKGEGAFGAEGMMGGEDEGGLALTSDFWSTAPSTTVHSPVESRSYHRQHSDYYDPARAVKVEELDSKEMEVDFEDLVNGDVCGPASASSAAPPFPSYQPTPQRALTPVYAPSPVPLPSNTHSGASLFLSGMSMPVDLLAVNAGISPQLTGGLPTPPLPDPGQEPAEEEWMTAVVPEDTVGREEEVEEEVAAAVKSEHEERGASRESSQSRREDDKIAAVAATNLVAKDAVVAAKVIEAIANPPKSVTGLQLLVLGVPVVGAKSRVETQIKISLVLVGQKAGTGRVKAEDEERSVEDVMTSDGGLQEGAGDELTRIGTWSHVRLPKFLALKKKNKKQAKADPDEANTLILDVAVIRGSEPHDEIFICTGCRQREHKRAQRKKEARVRPANEAADAAIPDEDEERRKVVVFNCSEYVEFGAGEVVLPTRITCYCRHHKERKGFSVTFSLRTSTGVVVASGSSPPIMITDDHKTSSVRPSAANSVSHSADVSFDSLDVDAPPAPAPKAKPAKAVKKDKPSAVAASARPKRAARGKTVRGATESDEEFEEPLAARGTGKKHAAAAKPYDSDARPRKRQSGVHKSPSFAMTPLTMSKPPSPTLRPVPDAHINVPAQSSLETGAAGTESWESALGLGGMDSVMADATTGRHGSNAFSVASAYSTAASNAPSPAQSYDWRSNASSPPLSPGSNSTAADTFSSFFNALQSPDMASSIASTSHSALPSPQPQQLQSGDGSFGQLYTPSSSFVSIPQTVPSMNWSFPHPRLTPPPPRISRLIPGEGPVHGGIEVTVLGENFVRDLVCVFGDSAAVPTHFWSSSTLVCILPPSANPGPVVVGIKGVPLTVEQGTGLQLFTYKDDSDRSLLELALQVVGLKMTGRLEDASAVAMRIVGNNSNAQASASRQVSPTGPVVDTAALAMRMSEASASVYASPPASRPPSRQASMVNLTHLSGSPASTSTPLPFSPVAGETRNFEGIVIKFLSLIDLDPSLIPGSAPSLPLALSPISHVNAQRHSLLHLATVLGFHRLVQFLLARGIAIESADRNGFTALHFAALYGRVAITRQLLEAGADRSARNLAGKTPLDIARDRDDIDVEEIFFRSRAATTSTVRPQQHRFDLPPYESSSAPGTPRSEYSRSVVSDYDASDSGSEEESSSFDSSEEDSEDDEERTTRISRNPSMVSLHYLLEAEADVNAEFSPLRMTVLPLPFVDEKKLDTIAPPVDLKTAKLSPTAWLSRSFQKPAVVPFDPSSDKVPQRPISIGVWDKMPGLPNGAWEKMRLPNAFALPLQMPAVTAFPSMASMPAFPKSWMSGRSEGIADSGGEASGSESEGKVVKEWPMRAWWPSKALDSLPPPVYSATDTLVQAAPSPTSSTSSLPPMRASSSGSKRRSAMLMDEQIARSDRMLMLFWLPVLILVLAFAAYSSFHPYIRPVLALVTESMLGSGTAEGAPINPLAAAWLQQRDNL